MLGARTIDNFQNFRFSDMKIIFPGLFPYFLALNLVVVVLVVAILVVVILVVVVVVVLVVVVLVVIILVEVMRKLTVMFRELFSSHNVFWKS